MELKNRVVHFDFRWKRVSRFKNTVSPAPALHSTHGASAESVNLRKLVGAARGPIGSIRSTRLEAGRDRNIQGVSQLLKQSGSF